MDRRVVIVVQFKLGGTQRADTVHRFGREAFEQTLGDRRMVLEQAVHPRIVVGVEREGRGIDARTTRGIGNHRRRRTLAARAGFEVVEALFERLDGLGDTRRTDRIGHRRRLGIELADQGFEVFDVALAAGFVHGAIGAGHEADRRHFAATAAAAMAARRGVVVVAVQHHPLDVAVGAGGTVDEAGRRVGRARQEFETSLQRVEQRDVLIALDQGAGAANLDAFETARAFPRIDRHRIETARTRGGFFHGVEERTGPGHREHGKRRGKFAEVLLQHRIVTGYRFHGTYNDIGEGR